MFGHWIWSSLRGYNHISNIYLKLKLGNSTITEYDEDFSRAIIDDQVRIHGWVTEDGVVGGGYSACFVRRYYPVLTWRDYLREQFLVRARAYPQSITPHFSQNGCQRAVQIPNKGIAPGLSAINSPSRLFLEPQCLWWSPSQASVGPPNRARNGVVAVNTCPRQRSSIVRSACTSIRSQDPASPRPVRALRLHLRSCASADMKTTSNILNEQ